VVSRDGERSLLAVSRILKNSMFLEYSIAIFSDDVIPTNAGVQT